MCGSRTLQVEGIVEEGRFGAGWNATGGDGLSGRLCPSLHDARIARLDGILVSVVMVLLGYVVADISVWVGRCCTGCVCVCVCSYDLIL